MVHLHLTFRFTVQHVKIYNKHSSLSILLRVALLVVLRSINLQPSCFSFDHIDRFRPCLLNGAGFVLPEPDPMADPNPNSKSSLKILLVGIFGLSLSAMSEAPHFNLLDRMIHEKMLHQDLFAVYLGGSATSSPDRRSANATSSRSSRTAPPESEITFGDYRAERMASPMVWTPVTQPGYWQVEIADLHLNNEPLNLCAENGCQVLVASRDEIERRMKSRIMKEERSSATVERLTPRTDSRFIEQIF